MSNEKFTPGPWHANWEGNTVLFPFVWQKGGFAVAKMCGKPKSNNCPVFTERDLEDPEKVKANAALIAAAPEMFEFINWIRSVQGQCAIIKGKKLLPQILDKADEVLKKARGEA